jgi:hypothetical protein
MIQTVELTPVNSKLINKRRVAEIRRSVIGAQQRINRLEKEISTTRSILRRRFIEIPLTDGNREFKRLQPFAIAAYRNNKWVIEYELAIARRDFIMNNRSYKEMIIHNLKLNRDRVKKAKSENNIRRQTNNLFQKTLKVLQHERANGGAEKVQRLVDLAKSGNVKEFRTAFDEYGPDFDSKLYYTVSGIQNVKTEILHELMDVIPSTEGISMPINNVPLAK